MHRYKLFSLPFLVLPLMMHFDRSIAIFGIKKDTFGDLATTYAWGGGGGEMKKFFNSIDSVVINTLREDMSTYCSFGNYVLSLRNSTFLICYDLLIFYSDV